MRLLEAFNISLLQKHAYKVLLLAEEGSDPNTSQRLDNTPAEKHNKAAKDSESKQARTHEQETNPVGAFYCKHFAHIQASKLQDLRTPGPFGHKMPFAMESMMLSLHIQGIQ